MIEHIADVSKEEEDFDCRGLATGIVEIRAGVEWRDHRVTSRVILARGGT